MPRWRDSWAPKITVAALVRQAATAEDFDRPLRLVEHRELRVLSRPALRFEGTAELHRTIFLGDPSNNVIEFKNYDDPRLQY